MAVLPAFCNRCGTAFGSGIVGSGGSTIDASGAKSGPCPVCGGEGTVPEGVFNLQDHLVTLVSGPASTYAKLEELRRVLTHAQSRHASTEDTLRAVEAIDPTVATIARMLKPDRVVMYLSLIACVIDLVARLHTPAPLTREDARTLIGEAVAEMRNEDMSREEINRNDGRGLGRVEEMKQADTDNKKSQDKPISQIRT